MQMKEFKQDPIAGYVSKANLISQKIIKFKKCILHLSIYGHISAHISRAHAMTVWVAAFRKNTTTESFESNGK